jgi:hypothetical protein
MARAMSLAPLSSSREVDANLLSGAALWGAIERRFPQRADRALFRGSDPSIKTAIIAILDLRP